MKMNHKNNMFFFQQGFFFSRKRFDGKMKMIYISFFALIFFSITDYVMDFLWETDSDF